MADLSLCGPSGAARASPPARRVIPPIVGDPEADACIAGTSQWREGPLCLLDPSAETGSRKTAGACGSYVAAPTEPSAQLLENLVMLTAGVARDGKDREETAPMVAVEGTNDRGREAKSEIPAYSSSLPLYVMSVAETSTWMIAPVLVIPLNS